MQRHPGAARLARLAGWKRLIPFRELDRIGVVAALSPKCGLVGGEDLEPAGPDGFVGVPLGDLLVQAARGVVDVELVSPGLPPGKCASTAAISASAAPCAPVSLRRLDLSSVQLQRSAILAPERR